MRFGRRSGSLIIALACAAGSAFAQARGPCVCGTSSVPRPANRTAAPYAGAPEDLRPYSHFTHPYYEHYTKLVEYNGAARDVADPELSQLDEIRIGFLGPLENHPDEKLGRAMLHGAQMAIDEANAAGGYQKKPFRLMIHNDQATWGSSSNEIVKMAYDEKVWGMLGSISGDSTHIALRVTLKAEVPMVNSAATDPTIPETIIPWYLTVLQDDRVQSYTLARRIFSDLGLQRVAILRVNDRYGRFGVLKFRDAARRLGHATVIEQKYMLGDKDFHRQLQVIQDSQVDAILLWGDAEPAGNIVKQMREMGMKHRVFGSFRVLGDEFFANAGPAAEGVEIVYPYDPTSENPRWLDYQKRYEAAFHAKSNAFDALAYDAMNVLLDSICQAGLNRGRIRDAMTSMEHYAGVTGEVHFDPNCKNVMPLYLATIRNGKPEFRRYPMEKPYAKTSESPLSEPGAMQPDLLAKPLTVAVFGPNAPVLIESSEVQNALKTATGGVRLAAVESNRPWGQASSELVKLLFDQKAIALIATDRNSSHLALQLGNKAELPVIAITSDRTLLSLNLPWLFEVSPQTSLSDAIRSVVAAIERSGPNRSRLRAALDTTGMLAGRVTASLHP